VGYQTEAEKNAGGKKGCYALKDAEWGWREGYSWRQLGFNQQDNEPVACVSWSDAQAYLTWLNGETGRSYRLPTEAEWEYAARAGTTAARYWGDDEKTACLYANVADENRSRGTRWNNKFPCDDGYNYVAPVGSKRANSWGLHDMLGNVWEWTCSAYEAVYVDKERECVSNNYAGRVALRGGSWNTLPRGVRAASRHGDARDYRYGDIGLRLAQD
jgi:serine/threonine-protein kinase PpkA